MPPEAQATDAPADLADLSAQATSFRADPYPILDELRRRGPAHRVRLLDGTEAWLIVSYAEARTALADPRLRKDWQAAAPALRKTWQATNTEAGDSPKPKVGRHMLSADPPDHTRLRRLVSKAFTPRRVEELRPKIQRTTHNLLDAMLPKGEADLLDALAFPLSLSVICEILGVPLPDQDRFRTWTHYLIANDGTPEAAEATHQFHAYLHDLIVDKRNHPSHDILSTLIQVTDGADEGGGRLSPDELHATALILLLAGHETTLNLIGNTTLALLQHPDQLAALRADWSLLDNAIAETLRYDGPLKTASVRFAAEEVKIGDTVIPADGSPVLIALAAADRDPTRFEDPHRFDIVRNTNGHLAFGHGIHYCLGASLARMEGTIALRALLERCPDLELATPAHHLTWRGGMPIRGLTHLRIRFTAAPTPST